MRRISIAILACLLAASAVATAAERERPHLGCRALARPGEKTLAAADIAVVDYEVRHYALDLSVDPEASGYGGTVTVVFAPKVLELPTLVLDAVGLTVTGVQHASGALTYRAQGDSLAIDLPAAKLGEEDQVTIAFTNEYGDDRYGMAKHAWGDLAGADCECPAVATLSQPSHAREWWPCLDRPGDKATAAVTITSPELYTAVSNGVLLGVDDNPDGTRTWRWATDHAIASYLISVAVSQYSQWSESCELDEAGPVTVEGYAFPYDLADAQQDFAPTCAMLGHMETLAGPYPFPDEKYAHVQYMNTPRGAMEHQTATSYGHELITGTNGNDWVVIHEIAHQWFGDSVGPDSWKDIWLNEGFATYCEALWFEHLNGFSNNYQQKGYIDYMMLEILSGTRWTGRTPAYDPRPDILDRVVYDKGAWILHQLRGRFRLDTGDDDLFFDMLRDWATASHRVEGVVTTQDFIDHASAWAGESLDAHLWPYLAENTVPQLSLAWELTGDDRTLNVVLQDQGGVAFDNKYPLRVDTAAGPEWVVLHHTGGTASQTYTLGAAVLDVTLDPDTWLAWQSVEVAPTPLRLLGAAPNPVADGAAKLRFRMQEDLDLTLSVYDARGRLVSERALGPRPGSLLDVHEVEWDGRGDDGARANSGTYWAVLRGGGHETVARFTLLR
ncbi:hypothetical protein KDK88_03340 [bacterium]|nr:hypothetical protein [bacterium]